MALSISGLKEVMMNSTYMLDISAANSLTPLGTAIAAYIVANAELLFLWTGINGSPPFDTESNIPATGNIITCTITLTPSLAIVPVTGLVFLATQIVAGIRLGTINITQPPWATAPVTMIDCPDFTLIIDGTPSRDSAYDQIATQLVSQIIAYQPSLPVSGTHGTYVGATTLCTIS
jgi:hypothetical protein